ncbi:MAG: thymidylate synthase, partial [Solirubrobacteraceae bacterium]
MSQTFEALYHPELLHTVNPSGDIGLVTLWSPLQAAERTLDSISPAILDPEHSRIVAISNLYGDGMYAMFCNLLFNPQVRHLIAIGQDLALPTCHEIEAFLARGLEDTVMLGAPMKRIVGTARVFPANHGFDESRLRRLLSFRYLGKLTGASLASDLTSCLQELPRAASGSTAGRIRVDMAEATPGERLQQPSELSAHQVIRRRPLDCWEELVVRAIRFGRAVTLGSGPRLELLNAKAVITEPAPEPAEALRSYGFALADFQSYQAQILSPELPEEISYTYGNRLRGYFHRGPDTLDTLQAVIDALASNPESRHGYIALWDTPVDLPGGAGAPRGASPCMVTLFFRNVDGALSLTATYRSHNLLTAWLENAYGLMAIQRHVADGTRMAIGPITIVSHSLGLDPRSPRYALARSMAERWKRDDDRDQQTGRYSLREDPNGYFVVTVDRDQGCIVAEHRFHGVLVKRYTGARADRL